MNRTPFAKRVISRHHEDAFSTYALIAVSLSATLLLGAAIVGKLLSDHV
jgi:hypothetical protein